MGENSKIGWTDHTFNPWMGCERVSPGCQHCYAESWAKRSGLVEWGKTADRRVASEAQWRKPIRWNADAEADGVRRRVFCASLADVFEDRPEVGAARARLFDLIEVTPMLDWLLLTKRPENVPVLLVPAGWIDRPLRPDDWERAVWTGPRNVWLGVTAENQDQADVRIPWLLSFPSPVRFVSCEPLLGPVDLREINPLRQRDDDWPRLRQNALTDRVSTDDLHPWHVDWVIVGGESGPGHREMSPEWARGIVDQCDESGVAVFFKQMGGLRGSPAGGDLLDGREWKEFPDV